MKCPKCGGEIPFYDLKPNCRHCGVNIFYYTQDHLLERDAKRTELESAVMRMLVARVKAVFIGSLLAIFRMVFLVGAVCAMMIPFCTTVYKLPFYEEKLSVGLIGLISAYGDGMLMSLPNFLKSSLFANATLGTLTVCAFFALLAIVDVAMLLIYLLSFLKPDKTARMLRNASAVACVLALGGQIASVVCKLSVVKPQPFVSFGIGFGGIACFALHLILIVINVKMLKKGVEPVYREFDPRRGEMLKKVRSGEVDLDDLSLPVFESEEEYASRMKEFEQAMEEEAAAELEAKIQADAKAKEEEANSQ